MNAPETSCATETFIHEFVTNFLAQVPFCKILGCELITLTPDHVQLKMPMKDELVGNYLHGILHGGAISSLIDMTGGILAMVATLTKKQSANTQEALAGLAKSGTIDLRVDYLSPGKGEAFICSANLLRSGNKVSVARIDLHNENNELIAVGTGSYLCG